LAPLLFRAFDGMFRRRIRRKKYLKAYFLVEFECRADGIDYIVRNGVNYNADCDDGEDRNIYRIKRIISAVGFL
jgi:hypothetical protein